MLLNLLTLSLFLAPALLAIQLLLNFFTPGLGKIPGPFLARFSDLWRFIDACLGHRDRTILHLHKKYGQVVRIGPNCVTVADPAAIDLVLGLKSNLDKSDHVKPMSNPVEGEVLPMLISARDSKVHAQRKRPIAGAFSMTNVLGYEDVVDQNITKLTSRLREEYVDGKSGAKPCPMDKWMNFFSFDLIGEVTFSKPFGLVEAGHDINDMIKVIDLQFLYIGTVGFMPWIDYLLLKNPLLLALLKTPNYLVSFTSERIRKRLSGEEKDSLEKPDFLTRFIDTRKQHPDTVSDLQVKAYASTNVLAASDTTSSALNAIILHVLQHPAVHQRLLNEIDSNDLSFPPSYSKSQALPYPDAVIKESLRYTPTIAVEMERVAGPAGLSLPSGHVLPPGTIVGINPWPIHRNTDIFGEDAEEFRPERWLKSPGESTVEFEERHRDMQRNFIEFGHGPRACIGKHMALLELYKLIPTLFGLFDVISPLV